MTTYAYCLVAFWVGAIWGGLSGDDFGTLLLPAFVTVISVLLFAAKGLGWG